jgi:hypothetical protein
MSFSSLDRDYIRSYVRMRTCASDLYQQCTQDNLACDRMYSALYTHVSEAYTLTRTTNQPKQNVQHRFISELHHAQQVLTLASFYVPL